MIKYADKIDAIVNYFRYVFKQNKQCHHINYLPHIKIILNKFDLDEFKTLQKIALKEEIFLLPGIELSVKDGKSGIHTLVIFNDDWVRNNENKNYINDFLGLTFAGQSNYENANARSNHNILQTITELEKLGRDYFLLFANTNTCTY